MSEQDIDDIIATTDGDTTWGDDLRGAITTLKGRVGGQAFAPATLTRNATFGFGTGTANVTVAYTGRREYWLFFNPYARTATALGFNVATAMGTPGQVGRFGIYTCTTALEPGDLIVDLGTKDCSSTGDKEFTGLSVTLAAGFYYSCVVSDASWAPKVTTVALPGVPRSGGVIGWRLRGATVTTATALPSTGDTVDTVAGTTTAAGDLFYITAA